MNFLIFAVLLPLALCSFPSGEFVAANNSRVVIIPDVHGDVAALLRSLWLAHSQIDGANATMDYIEFCRIFDVASKENRYPDHPISSAAPGSVSLIQLGDLVDRGPYSLECIGVIREVERVIGWTVRILYGNHEILNMLGTANRFLHPAEVARAGDEQSRQAPYAPGQPMHTVLTQMSLGMVRLSGAPEGMPRDHPRNPNTLFVHAGIDLDWMDTNHLAEGLIEKINAIFTIMCLWWADLMTLSQPHSPLWSRDLAKAHTPQSDMMVKSRCDGRVVLTDAMMSRWMLPNVTEESLEGGRPVAVIMTMGDDGLLDSVVAHYTDLKTGSGQEQTLLFPQEIHNVGPYSPGLADRVREWTRQSVQAWESPEPTDVLDCDAIVTMAHSELPDMVDAVDVVDPQEMSTEAPMPPTLPRSSHHRPSKRDIETRSHRESGVEHSLWEHWLGFSRLMGANSL